MTLAVGRAVGGPAPLGHEQHFGIGNRLALPGDRAGDRRDSGQAWTQDIPDTMPRRRCRRRKLTIRGDSIRGDDLTIAPVPQLLVRGVIDVVGQKLY